MENKVVFEGLTKDGKKYLIRYPEIADVQEMCDYMNILSQEQTFITFQGEKLTLEDEIKYLENILKKIDENKAIKLLAFSDNKIIGISDITMKDKVTSHEGTFGITVSKDYRGQGIGKTLMELVLKEAESNLPQLRIVSLAVFGDNPLAYGIYKMFGFHEFGRLSEGILHKGKYVDHIYMYKKIR